MSRAPDKRDKPAPSEAPLAPPDMIALAKSTLQAVCRNAQAPAAARAQAARTLLELAGALRPGGSQEHKTAPAEMTAEALDKALARLS